MKLAILLTPFLAASALLAQQPQPKPAVGPGAAQASQIVSCPVVLRALQGSGGALVATRNAPPKPDTGQSIHLLVTPLTEGKTIASLSVTAIGLSPRSHFQPVDGESFAAPALQKTIDVTLGDEDARTQFADLRLAGFSVVNSIAVRSITYTDGSTWKVPAQQACSVTPDYFMRIAAN